MATLPTRPPGMRVVLHALWPVEKGSPALTPEARERLTSYVTRYAQTLNTGVYAVGGAHDHLHVLYDLPPGLAPDQVTKELQRTTVRFLRDTLSLPDFDWNREAAFLESVSAAHRDDLIAYIGENAARHEVGDVRAEWEFFADRSDTAATSVEPSEAVPAWLSEALTNARGKGSR